MNSLFKKKILSKGLAEKLIRKGYVISKIEYKENGREIYYFNVEGNFFKDLDQEISDFKKIKFQAK